ncbi:hypothetical protein BBFGKLBO_02229 [Synechococcus sp. CBW1107]|nr:hypothetical protein BBFGKLBO_02229 [Synechococcus sp. CBW1107]
MPWLLPSSFQTSSWQHSFLSSVRLHELRTYLDLFALLEVSG